MSHATQDLSAYLRAAQIVLPCQDLAVALELLTLRLGFRLESIFPADSPHTAVISGHGVTLRLETSATETPAKLRLLAKGLPDGTPFELAAGGLRLELAEANPPLELPHGAQEFVVSRLSETNWRTGRAGMQYRDLIPGRLGGRFVASHIRIPTGGPVPDYVHFHKVRFQMIYCLAGEALLVYEDQGPPFVFAAGDCVPQPPEIRHRVLQASDGFEVIEIGCPALHETCADHELTLPNQPIRPERIFNGQRFAHHIARAALWQSADGLEFRDTGIAHATGGLARARVLRPSADFATQHQGEFLFYFVLRGELGLAAPIHGKHLLSAGDSCVIPADTEFILNTGQGMELLEVALPAAQPQNFPLRNIS